MAARIARLPGARPAYRRVRTRVDPLLSRVPAISFDSAVAPVAVRMAYEVMLGREPDATGLATYASGPLSRDDLVASLRCSEEFNRRPMPASALGPSLHLGRQQFIRSLPQARRILDLGGTHLADRRGALVMLGYPYDFDELVIVDLPSDERHDIYRSAEQTDVMAHGRGTIRYSYHSMADLSRFADGSFDLVYSGQSIEHVSTADARHVLREVHRVLAPGGALALDTPNGRVTRLQQAEFIDPDHEAEYTWPELAALLDEAGLAVERAQGLTWVPSATEGRFDLAGATAHPGLHDALEACYLLAVVCRRA